MGQLALGLLTFGVQAIGAVAQYSAQKQEAKANQKNAEQAWKNDQQQITLRHMQEEEALRQKQRQSRLEEAEVAAETAASAANSGVAGISLGNLMADVSRRAAGNREVESENTRMIISQLKQQRKGANAQAQSRINAVPKPSGLSLIAGIGSAALSGYRTATKTM